MHTLSRFPFLKKKSVKKTRKPTTNRIWRKKKGRTKITLALALIATSLHKGTDQWPWSFRQKLCDPKTLNTKKFLFSDMQELRIHTTPAFILKQKWGCKHMVHRFIVLSILFAPNSGIQWVATCHGNSETQGGHWALHFSLTVSPLLPHIHLHYFKNVFFVRNHPFYNWDSLP